MGDPKKINCMTKSSASGLKVLWNYYTRRDKYHPHPRSSLHHLALSPLIARMAYVNYIVHSINALYFKYIRIAVMTRGRHRRRRYWAGIPLQNSKHLMEARPFSAWYRRSKYYDGTIIFSDPVSNSVYYISRKVRFIYIFLVQSVVKTLKPKVFYIWRKNLLVLNYLNFYIKKFKSRFTDKNIYHFFNPYHWNFNAYKEPEVNYPSLILASRRVFLGKKGPLARHITNRLKRQWLNELKDLRRARASRIRLNLNEELRSFKWKFFNRKWYFKFSRWKASRLFRKALFKAQSGYRKLKRNSTFVKLFQINFSYILGLSQKDLFLLWRPLRVGFNNAIDSKVKHLYISLNCKLDFLIVMLGLAPNRYLSEEIVKSGFWAVNGNITLNHNHLLMVGDLHQMNSCYNISRSLNKVRSKTLAPQGQISTPAFLQKLNSLMLLYVTRWPYSYEVHDRTLMTERWLRWFVRYYPNKVRRGR